MCCTNNELEYVTEEAHIIEADGMSFTVHVVGIPSDAREYRVFVDENEASRYAESLAKRTNAVIAS